MIHRYSQATLTMSNVPLSYCEDVLFGDIFVTDNHASVLNIPSKYMYVHRFLFVHTLSQKLRSLRDLACTRGVRGVALARGYHIFLTGGTRASSKH